MKSDLSSVQKKKVVSDSPELADFAVRLADSVFHLPMGKEIQITGVLYWGL